MKKRISAIFLMLCMMVSLLPVNAITVNDDSVVTYGETAPTTRGTKEIIPLTKKVGEEFRLETDHRVISGITDEGWSNSDYSRVQLSNYWGSLVENVRADALAVSPGVTTITYKDDGYEIAWVITVEEDNTPSEDNNLIDGRDSFTFSEESSNIDVAYSYVVDDSVSPQATSDLIPMDPGETIRLPGLASEYPIAFYVRATKGYAPYGSTFDCAGSQGYYYEIGTDPDLPGAGEASEQHYTKEFSFSSRKSGYPDREFIIEAVPVKVHVVYEGEGVTNTDANVYTHERVEDSDVYLHTITLPEEPVLPGYEFKGWQISTEGIELNTRNVYQAGDTLSLDDTTWVSATEENATVTFTAQWVKKDLNQGGSNDYVTIDKPVSTDPGATSQSTVDVHIYRDGEQVTDPTGASFDIKFAGPSASVSFATTGGNNLVGTNPGQAVLSSVVVMRNNEQEPSDIINITGNGEGNITEIYDGASIYLFYSTVFKVEGTVEVDGKSVSFDDIVTENDPDNLGFISWYQNARAAMYYADGTVAKKILNNGTTDSKAVAEGCSFVSDSMNLIDANKVMTVTAGGKEYALANQTVKVWNGAAYQDTAFGDGTERIALWMNPYWSNDPMQAREIIEAAIANNYTFKVKVEATENVATFNLYGWFADNGTGLTADELEQYTHNNTLVSPKYDQTGLVKGNQCKVTFTAPAGYVLTGYGTTWQTPSNNLIDSEGKGAKTYTYETNGENVADQGNISVYAFLAKDENNNLIPDSGEFTLTYNANGGSWTTESGTVSQQKEFILKPQDGNYQWHTLIYSDTEEDAASPAPSHAKIEKDGKQITVLFVGWTLDDTNLEILDKDAQKNGTVPKLAESVYMDQNKTVYAVWAEDQNNNGEPDYQDGNITVKFDANGGTFASGTVTEFVLEPFPEYPVYQTAPTVTPPTDETFVKWTLSGNENKVLQNGAQFNYDIISRLTGVTSGTVEFEANYQASKTIAIAPADMTVYMGGKGYVGTVTDESGDYEDTVTENGFPEPGFTVEWPADLVDPDINLLTLQYADEGVTYQWGFEPYDNNPAHDIYRIVPLGATQARPVRMEFTKTLEDGGDLVISDSNFDPSLNLNQTLIMKVYGEGIDQHKVSFMYAGKPYEIAVENAELTVRGTTDAVLFSNDKPEEGVTLPVLEDTAGITYKINGSEVVVTNDTNVALLFDDIVESNAAGEKDYTALLKDKVDAATGAVTPGNFRNYEYKYLDLVDTSNGNAWVTPSGAVTIKWPLPAGTDTSTAFTLLHFENINRSMTPEQVTDALTSETYQPTVVQNVRIDDGYVVFETDSFSPFVLTWESKAPQYTITATAYDGGSISPSGNVTVNHGAGQTFTITAGTNYRISKVLVDGVSQGAISTYTFANVTGNHTIEAYFTYVGGDATQSEFELHYVTNGGKYLSVESEIHVWTKDHEDLPVPERDGYTFVGWYWDLRLNQPVTGDVKVDVPVVVLYAKWEKDGTWTGSGDVSNWLDTVNHKAFLSGYPDGTFGTDRNMTRAEVAQMFYSLLLDKDVKITKTFTDVPADAWYADAVNTLASLGMLGGYPDGTFQPDRTITRAEFAVVALAFTDGGSGASCSFTDVNRSDWFYQYAAQASAYGWIGGYPDGSFRPNNKITRAEVSVIVNNMLGRDADERFIDRNGDELVSFTDLTDGHWAYYAIMEATNTHTYTRDGSTEVWKAAT